MFGYDLMGFLKELVYTLPAIIVALSVHEFAHAFVAYKLGDASQKERGRLSLNPLRHLDPMGTICLLFFRFGWAKPVQVDPYFFRNRKEGMMWTAIAGPLMNLIMGFIMSFLFVLAVKSGWLTSGNAIISYLMVFLRIGAIMNVGLGIFNLIPIPPLDGSKVLMGILPEETYFNIMRYEQYISLLLLFVLFSGFLDGPLIGARSAILDGFTNIAMMLLGVS